MDLLQFVTLLYIREKITTKYFGTLESRKIISEQEISMEKTKCAKKKCKWFIGIVVILTILVSSIACHKKANFGHEKIISKIADRISSKLDLNDDQEEMLNAIGGKIIGIVKENKPEHLRLKESIAKLVLTEQISAVQINEIIDAKRKLMEKVFKKDHDKLVAMFIDLHGTLTTEQKEELAELIRSKGCH